MRTRVSAAPSAAPAGPSGGRRPPPAAPTPFTQALANLRPRVVALHPTAPCALRRSPRAEASTHRSPSLLVVPLARATRPSGGQPVPPGKALPFDEGDGSSRSSWPHTRAVHRQRAALHSEHTVAATVQRQLLPRRPVTHRRWRPPTSPSLAPIPAPVRHHRPVRAAPPRRRQGVGTRSDAARDHGTAAHAVRSLSRSTSPRRTLARLHHTAGQLAAERSHLRSADPLRREALTPTACTP